MECISPLFRKTILQILGADRPSIATIVESGPPFLDRIRCRWDVLPVEITRENRDSLHRDIIALAGNLLEPPS
jgi:nucleoside-triphosphatase THEP1